MDQLLEVFTCHPFVAWSFAIAILVLLVLVVHLSLVSRTHKSVARALRSSENIQKAILEKAPLVLWAIDRKGIFTLSSGSALKAIGLNPGQVVGMSVFDVYSGSPEICDQTRLALEGKARAAIVRVGPRWFEMDYATQYNAQGAITGAIGIARDVTEQVEAQQMQRRLAIAVEASVEAIVLTDKEGTIEYVNPSFERITGYSREEAFGKNLRILKSGLHDASYYAEIWKTLLDGKAWSGRFQNKRKDGRLYMEDSTITPMLDKEGVIQGYIAVKRDITQEVNMEDSLRRAQRTEEIGKLAGGIAHDFNNILQVIHSNVSFAKESHSSPSELAEYLEHIQQASMRASALTRQLLAFSRKQTLRYEVLELPQVITDVLKLIRRVIGEHIQVGFNPPASLDRIRGDQGQLEQVILNLCVNARDAMKEGGRLSISLRNIELREQDLPSGLGLKPGHYVEMMVADNGHGMDEETKAHVFEPFFTTKPVGQGTGLGLPVVQGIVHQHEGYLHIESWPGEGTQVSVRLPAIPATEELPEHAHEEEAKPSARQSGHETILLAEDDPNVRQSTRMLLVRHGYRVVLAIDGEDACKTAMEHLPNIDVLVLDVVMPRLGGIEAAQRIQSMQPGIPVILCSGYAGGISSTQELPDSSWTILLKPYNGSDLLTRIRGVLDKPGRS